MKITWFGHSCFLIESSKGIKILTDPFDNTIGYKPFKGEVDILTISHNHFDHNCKEDIEVKGEILDKVGMFNICDTPIQGIASYHDKFNGTKRGANIIYTFNIDEYRICHLGDLGHMLTQKQIEAIGQIDVLLIPIGGNYTIDGKEAAEIAKNIGSKIILPMHYKTPDLNFPLGGLEEFLLSMKNGEKLNTNTLEVHGPINEHNSIKILDYK